MTLFEISALLTLDTAGFAMAAKKASQQGSALASSLSGATTTIINKTSAAAVAVGNLAADTVKQGGSLLKQLATVGIGYNAQMETYVTNFQTMLGGSAEAAQQLTTDLEEMAASTPFAMTDLASATQTLLAYGQDSETVMGTLQSLGDIAMGDANKLNSLTLAFSQASSSGKLMGTDLQQMINAGFNPLNTIAEQTGASMGDLKEFMSSGKATGDLRKQMRAAQREVKQMGDQASDGAKMLAQMAEEGGISADLLGQVFAIETSPGGTYYQAMENAAKTYDGLMSTLQDDSKALMGRVFEPLSTWMKDDLLPNAIDFIGRMDTAFSEGGLPGLVNAAMGEIGGVLEKGYDAGAGFLADVLSGLTGDTVTSDQIKSTISDLFQTGVDKITEVKDTAGALLGGIWEGLNADAATEGNIVTKLGGLFSEGMEAKTAFQDAATGLLGSIWESLTGQEATAENIGKTIGGLFSEGIEKATELAGVAKDFFDYLAKASSGENDEETRSAGATFGKGVSAFVMGAGIDLAEGLGIISEEDAAGAREYFSYEEGTESAAIIDAMFGTLEQQLDAGIIAEDYYLAQKYGIHRSLIDQFGDIFSFTKAEITSGTGPLAPLYRAMGFGYSQDEIDAALAQIRGGTGGSDATVQTVGNGWETFRVLQDEEGAVNVEGLNSAIDALKSQLDAFPDAISRALENITITLDGYEVGTLVEPGVSAAQARNSRTAGKTD